ncbi:MAG TPA: prolyl oligopeptidase family serine peptidase [Thermoanaerobaculia bacterium]|nr:prolyl oligopeptidase family serine peptidase [Thermoanaerobaculia bacterium]
MPQLYRNLAAAALLLLPWPAFAASPEPTLETVMAHPDWIGNPPEEPYWADDGRSVFYLRKRAGEEQKDLIRVDLESGIQTLVPLGERGKTDAPGGDLSRDRRWKTYARQGDIFLKDLQTGTIRQITRTEAEEDGPRFLVGDNRIAFQRGDATFVFDLVAATLFQPAELKLAKDPAEDEETGYVDEQQEQLFQVLREEKEKQTAAREEDRASRHLDPTRAPLPWYLGEEAEIVQSSLSPSGDWMLVVTQAKGAARKPSLMARFITEDGNLKSDEVRSKVGTEPPIDHKVLLLDLVKHEKHEVDLSKLPGITDDPLKELREKAQKAKEKDKDKKEEKKKEEEEEKKPRPVEIWALSWSDDGRYGALMIHASDNKDRWIATVEREKPAPVSRHRLTDPAWINWEYNELGFLPETDTLWYNSEETGHSNLYLVSMQAGKARRIVEGDFEVSNIVASRDGKHLYYRANQGHPGIYDVWRVPISDGKPEKLSKTGGETFFELSPDESRILLLHSTVTRHGDLFVQPNQPGAEAKQVTETHSPEYLAIEWSRPEIVPIPSSHVKKPIWSRVYTPEGFDPSRKYPAVVFTHGAGYLQNAHAGWSSYFREFMFHTLLTRSGYVVLDMDYRASAGYGRDWRTAIYRQMGHPEVEDLEDGVAWLVKNKSVDPQRVGTYGGSYGGFLTFMSMFRKPDLFAAGAALRPVTDWAFYNHEYTSNILNTPEVDPEAFEKSSPIEYAQGLTRPLLICTGMVDDNVFFQDSVRLVQRLIELKKENFETAIYPVEPHSFRQPTSWLDEYRRIFKLFETHLK